MASNKLNSAKFVAVYHMDFYKNKKNWMLYDQKIAKSNKKNILNVTFNVEQENLNDAFIETGSDTEKSSKSDLYPRASNLSQQWLENVNIWPADSNTLQTLLVGHRENDDRREQSESKSLFTLQDVKQNCIYGHWPATYQSPSEMQYCGFDHGDSLEFGCSVEADASEIPTDLWINEQFVEEQKLSASVDSYSAFCRGADLNPHCSEMELKLNESTQELDANAIARMSSTELDNSIQAHARTLAALLGENIQRLKLRQSSSSLSNEDSDVGRDHAEFVAGSFRNRDYCVHIEYGRPVRLKEALNLSSN